MGKGLVNEVLVFWVEICEFLLSVFRLIGSFFSDFFSEKDLLSSIMK